MRCELTGIPAGTAATGILPGLVQIIVWEVFTLPQFKGMYDTGFQKTCTTAIIDSGEHEHMRWSPLGVRGLIKPPAGGNDTGNPDFELA